MIQRWPSSCFGAVSSAHRYQNATARLILRRSARNTTTRRYYSKQKAQDDFTEPEKSALLAVQPHQSSDPVTPPRSTLPAPLHLPTPGPDNSGPMYYFRLGRAYGSFYWVGIKAVWFNYKAAQVLKARIKDTVGPQADNHALTEAVTRAEYQILHRNDHDIGKLPFFGVLVLCLGEWLPLFVPFMPGVVPGTCRIPKQVKQMRLKAEERRRVSFRQGIAEPSKTEMSSLGAAEQPASMPWPMTQKTYVAAMLRRLGADQLHHLSSSLNVHNRLWDRIQQRPPSSLLRRALSKRLAYLTSDDLLLAKYGGVEKLSPDELDIACEERGIDVSGKREETLRYELSWWLARQSDDQGRGSAIFPMLFKRPNAWEAKDER